MSGTFRGVVGRSALARSAAQLVSRAEDEAGVAEALSSLEALALVLCAAGAPAVGPRELSAEGLPAAALWALARRAVELEERAGDALLRAAIRRGSCLLGRGEVPADLSGAPGRLALRAPTPAAKPVAEETVLRLVRGELDGFRAAEVARELCRTAAGRRELAFLAGAVHEVPALLRLAADAPSTLRDPAQGELVAAVHVGRGRARLDLEAVRFDGGVLAIYASKPVALSLAPRSSELAVLASAPGYLEVQQEPVGRKLVLRAAGVAKDVVVTPKR